MVQALLAIWSCPVTFLVQLIAFEAVTCSSGSCGSLTALSLRVDFRHDAGESTANTVASAGEIRKSMMEREMTHDCRRSLLSQRCAGGPIYRDQGQYQRVMSPLQDGK